MNTVIPKLSERLTGSINKFLQDQRIGLQTTSSQNYLELAKEGERNFNFNGLFKIWAFENIQFTGKKIFHLFH